MTAMAGSFAIQHNSGVTAAVFFIRSATGLVSVRYWGLFTDPVVPGDYDGDGLTDIAVVRRYSGGLDAPIIWYIQRSSDGGVTSMNFGLSTYDDTVQGDYDGDGKTDVAVYRKWIVVPPGATFWAALSNGGTLYRPFGSPLNIAPAHFNTHPRR